MTRPEKGLRIWNSHVAGAHRPVKDPRSAKHMPRRRLRVCWQILECIFLADDPPTIDLFLRLKNAITSSKQSNACLNSKLDQEIRRHDRSQERFSGDRLPRAFFSARSF